MDANAASVAEQAEALVRSGRASEAVEMLQRAAAAEDADALFSLGLWNVAGQWVPRDLDAATELFGRSAKAGNQDAAHVHAAFITHGAGGRPDWAAGLALLEALAHRDEAARGELALIRRMALDEYGDPLTLPEPRRLSKSPDVTWFPALFSAEECRYLAEAAIPRLQRALVTERGSGRQIETPVRTADTAPFPLIAENPALHALNRRLAAASGTQVAQGEPLQVLRYAPGQEYRPHYDALPPGGNQRELTMLVYLNEEYEGGETLFLQTGLRFRGGRGDGLLFRNAFPDGQPDPASAHAGLPVLRGTKIIASRWIRAQPIDLSKPPV